MQDMEFMIVILRNLAQKEITPAQWRLVLRSCSTPKSLRKKFKKYKIVFFEYLYENKLKKIFTSKKIKKIFF